MVFLADYGEAKKKDNSFGSLCKCPSTTADQFFMSVVSI